MRIRPFEKILYLLLRTMKAFDRRPADAGAFDPEGVIRILVVSSTAIGDTLLSTPAIRAARKRYPGARIIALLNRKNMALFANNPNIDGVVPFEGGYRKFFRTVRELRRHSFDLALILHGNEPQATPLCYLSGARFIFKLPNTSEYAFLLSNPAPRVDMSSFPHAIELRLATAALAGCEPDGTRMDLVVDAADEAAAMRFLRGYGAEGDGPLIGFQAAAADFYKMWPAGRFIELGTRLLERFPTARIVLTGSPSESPLNDGIARAVGERVLNASGALNLKETAGLIKGLDLLVTGDTGPMHMAIALGTPVVALFAPTSSAGIGPRQDPGRHVIIQKGVDCDPCITKKCKDPVCMEKITVEEVFLAASGILETRGPGENGLTRDGAN